MGCVEVPQVIVILGLVQAAQLGGFLFTIGASQLFVLGKKCIYPKDDLDTTWDPKRVA